MEKGLHKGIGFLVISLALLAGGAALAAEPSPSTGLGVQPYKIGCAFDLTGPAAMVGDPSEKVARMVVEEVNAAGGINGHPVELVVEDTASDPTKAVMAVKKLITSDKVLAIIGPTTTGAAMAAVKTVEEAGVPMMVCAGGTPVVVPVKKWVFKTPQSDILAVGRLYDYLAKKGVKRVALLTSSSSFGQSGKAELVSQASGAGVEVVAEEKYNDDDKDMSAQLTSIKGKNPGAIIAWGIGPAPTIVVKNARTLGITTPLFLSHGLADPILIKLAGEASEGVMMPASKIIVAEALSDSDPQKKLLLEIKRKYEAKFNSFSVHASYAWDALYLIFGALKTAGTDPAKLRDAIENTRGFLGADGVFNLSPSDHNGLAKDSMVIAGVRKGAFALVD